MRQKNFYPIYPPPEHVCIDYEAWLDNAQLNTTTCPNMFIVSSDLATFNKEVNGCLCLNTGRLVRGTSTGSYALINVKSGQNCNKENNDLNTSTNTQSTSSSSSPISVSFHKI